MAPRFEELTDAQWRFVEPLLPKGHRRKDGKGRPRQDERAILNGILWILRTGARWRDLPDRFPSSSTCYLRFRAWINGQVMRTILERLAKHLYDAGHVDLSECFIDASFIAAKKGVRKSARLAAAKAPRSWQWQTLMVFQSPCTHEVLRQQKSPLCTKLSNKIFLPSYHNDSLGALQSSPGFVNVLRLNDSRHTRYHMRLRLIFYVFRTASIFKRMSRLDSAPHNRSDVRAVEPRRT